MAGAIGFLGRHFCVGLAQAGSQVVLVDLSQDECEKFALDLEENYKVPSIGISCDVTDPASVRLMTETVLERFSSIDILVYNAAYKSTSPESLYAPFEEYSLEEWKRMMDVNINGMFLCSQSIGSVMVKRGHGGSIILMSSIYGIRGTDHRIYEGSDGSRYRINNPASYSTTNGAAIALTKYLATYWADKGIRVNALSPGGVESDQEEDFISQYSSRVPMGRMAQPEEVVGALIYLASDASSYITGQNILVDGGLSVW